MIGSVPEPSFFEPEERCGYTVSAPMKKIWAVQLDLLGQLRRVCRENGLVCYAAGGTLLGAVRHGGYIPWDDDIDMVMKRPDYERLLAIAPQAFPPPYFLQTAYNDTRYSRGHAQLRVGGTAAILPGERGHYTFHQGIFIDIFPLDAIPDDPGAFVRQRRQVRLWEKLLAAGVRYPGSVRKTPLKSLLHLPTSLIPYRWIYRRMEAVCRRYEGVPTARLAQISFMPTDDRLIFPADGYARAETVPFEYTSVEVPGGCDEILRIQYGDYTVMRRDPTYHGEVLFDTERSYLDYLK